jgi:tRNA(Ile)-lysidine synthetase-like protein
MDKELHERVGAFIRSRRMCPAGDKILVACSGGPDSTALTDILRRLGFKLGVIYVDHRQHKNSAQVMASVRRRCRRWKLPFHGVQLEVAPGSSEDVLRGERYRAFADLAGRHGYRRVATGHTQSDQVETVLMRILRGTGVAGLGGIPAVRDIYIRPLLECSGDEVLAYLRSRRLRWHNDPTNRDQGFLRNLIRLKILPLLRRQVNPSVDRALLRLSQAAARDEEFIGSVQKFRKPEVSPNGTARLPLSLFDGLHDALAVRVIVDMLRSISSPGANLEKEHLDRVLLMIRGRRDGEDWRLDLSGGLTAGREGSSFYLRREDKRRR